MSNNSPFSHVLPTDSCSSRPAQGTTERFLEKASPRVKQVCAAWDHAVGLTKGLKTKAVQMCLTWFSRGDSEQQKGWWCVSTKNVVLISSL